MVFHRISGLPKRVVQLTKRPLVGQKLLFSSEKNTSTPSLPYSVAIPAGGITGIVSALTGVGGGIVLIPTLSRFTKLSQHSINATSLLAVTIGCTAGALSYVHNDRCDIPLATIIATSATMTTGLGVKCAHKISGVGLARLVSAAMLLIAPVVWNKESNKTSAMKDQELVKIPLDVFPLIEHIKKQWEEQRNIVLLSEEPQALIPLVQYLNAYVSPGLAQGIKIAGQFTATNGPYLMAGLLSGFLSGLLGLGGGIVMTSYLTATTDLPQTTIVGTSLLAIVPIGLSSSYHNLQRKTVHLPTAFLIGGTLCVSVWGASQYIALQVPEDTLRKFLGGALTFSALTMFRKTLKK